MDTAAPKTFQGLVEHIPKRLRGNVNTFVFLGFFGLSMVSLRAIFATCDPVAIHDLAPMYRLDQLFRVYDYPWDYKSNLGSPVMLTGNALYNLPLMGLSLAFGSVTFAHKVWLVLLMALAGFGFYFTFTYIVGSRTAGLVASLYSIFNSFTLTRWTYGHNTILLAYMVLPFALFFYVKEMTEGGRTSLVACGLLVGLLVASSPHVGYLFILLMLLYTGLDLVSSKRSELRRRIILRGLQLGFILGISLAVTIPIFYQIARVNLPVYSVRAEEAVLFIASGDAAVSMLPLGALGIFFAAAVSYFRRKRSSRVVLYLTSLASIRRSQIVFFLALGLFSVFLVVVATAPLTPIYCWLFNNVPGFSMFREVNKIFMLSVLSLSFFLGLMTEVFQRCSKRGSAITRKALPLLLTTLIVLAPSWQFLTGDLGGVLGTVEIPEEYRALEDWLSSEEESFRIALFPPAVWATTYNWTSKWFLDPLVALQVKPTVELKSEFDVTQSASLTRWVYTALYANRTSAWGRLLGILGVRYVVVRLDADMPSHRDDLQPFSLANTLKAWENQGDLDLEKTLGCLLVYRNPHQLLHIYQTEAFSLIVGDRRMLLSLNQLGFNFFQTPPLFLDDNIDSAVELSKDARYLFFQSDPYWSLITASSSEAVIIKPWIHTPLSANPTTQWVKGDLMWNRFNGDLNIATDGYIYTAGMNAITIPFNVEKPGDYRVLAQVFDGLPGSQGIKFTVNDAVNYTFKPTRSFEGSYVWIEVGHLSLKDQGMIHISSLGGPAAISKITLIPEASINEAEQSVCNQLQSSATHMAYIFDSHAWRSDPKALIVDPQASNGRLIDLSRSAVENTFYVFRNDIYTLKLRFQCFNERSIVKIHIDDYVENVRLSQGAEDSFTEVSIGSIELKRGYHDIRVEAEESDARLDVAILSPGTNGIEAASSNSPDSDDLNYNMLSGSEYVIDEVNSYLVFLEGGSGYWRLYGCEEELTSMNVFGYASLFHLSESESQYTLKYLGLTYLEQGFLITITVMALIAVGLRFLGSKRFIPQVYEHLEF